MIANIPIEIHVKGSLYNHFEDVSITEEHSTTLTSSSDSPVSWYHIAYI